VAIDNISTVIRCAATQPSSLHFRSVD
jgi:hypothetical protein